MGCGAVPAYCCSVEGIIVVVLKRLGLRGGVNGCVTGRRDRLGVAWRRFSCAVVCASQLRHHVVVLRAVAAAAGPGTLWLQRKLIYKF